MQIIDKILRKKYNYKFDIPAGMITTLDVETFKKNNGMNCSVGSVRELVEYIEGNFPDAVWQITLIGKSGKIRTSKVQNEFPTLENALEMSETWGGGKYNIFLMSPKRSKIGHYIITAEEKTPLEEDDEPETSKKLYKKWLKKYKPKTLREAALLQKFEDTGDISVLEEIEGGTETKKSKSIDDIAADMVANSPDLKKRLAEAEIEKRLGKPKKEQSKAEVIKELYEEYKFQQEMFEGKKEGFGLKDIVEFVRVGGLNQAAGIVQMILKEPEPKNQLIAKKPELIAPVQELQEEETFQITPQIALSKQSAETIAKNIPLIMVGIKTLEPKEAFDMVAKNTEYLRFADAIEEIGFNGLNDIVRKIDVPGLDKSEYFDEKSQAWIRKFIEINHEDIIKSSNLEVKNEVETDTIQVQPHAPEFPNGKDGVIIT